MPISSGPSAESGGTVRGVRRGAAAGGARAPGARSTVPLGSGRGGEPRALRLYQAADYAHVRHCLD